MISTIVHVVARVAAGLAAELFKILSGLADGKRG